MKIEVSIIIPVFNKADYLGACLDSALGQSFRNLEVICINDASEDRCDEILQDYAKRDARLKVISNTQNLGPGESRNKGIDAAKGKFLRFVDSDDLLPHQSTKILYLRAIEDDVELVKGSVELFSDSDLSNFPIVYAVPDKIRAQLMNEEDLWIPWWHTSYLISTELVRKNNLRYPNLIRGEDPVFLASVLVNTKYISLVSDVVYLYRQYVKAIGSGGTSIRYLMDNIRHAAMTKQLFMSHYPDCWHRGYGPFIHNDILQLLELCNPDPVERQYVESELHNIWEK